MLTLLPAPNIEKSYIFFQKKSSQFLESFLFKKLESNLLAEQ
jgi:hypothetical protein